MHILTGLLLGELFLGAGALKGLRGGGTPFELIHALPGRVRFRVRALVGDAAAARSLAAALGAVDGATEATADARSGSVTVRFAESAETRQAIITALEAHTATTSDGGGASGGSPAASELSLLRQKLKSLGHAIDGKVREETHGLADLETLLGVASGAWGMKTLLLPGTQSRLSGLSFLFWSYNMLRR